MAFEFNDLKLFLFLVFFTIPLTSSTNIDCNGKPFYCVNSTHFMICVDLGGKISTTIDDFVLACPLDTECHTDNRYECEFPKEVLSTFQPVSNVPTTSVTTLVPVDVTTEILLAETKVAESKHKLSSNKTEILENLREEYTDGNEMAFEKASTILSKEANYSTEQSIANGQPKPSGPATNIKCNTQSTIEKGTPSTSETPNLLVTTTSADNFYESNYKTIGDLGNDIKSFPTLKNQVSDKVITIDTTSTSPYLDTEQTISIEKPPDDLKDHPKPNAAHNNAITESYLKINTNIAVAIDEISSTDNILTMKTDYYKPTNNVDIVTETIAKINHSSKNNIIGSQKGTVNDMIVTSETPWQTENDYINYHTQQNDQLNKKENIFLLNTSEAKVSSISTNDLSGIKGKNYNKQVTEQYNFSLNVNSSHLKEKENIQGNVLTNVDVTTTEILLARSKVSESKDKLSPNKTEILENLREEYTDGSEKAFERTSTIVYKEANHSTKQSITNEHSKASIPATDIKFNIQSITEKATPSISEIPNLLITTTLGNNFSESNYKSIGELAKDIKPFPTPKNQFSDKDITIETASTSPHLYTEQTIVAHNNAMTESYMKINTNIVVPIDEINPTENILIIKTDYYKLTNNVDVVTETVAKSDHLSKNNSIDTYKGTVDDMKVTSETPWQSENDYVNYHTPQGDKLNKKENNILVNTSTPNASATSTNDLSRMKSKKYNTQVTEQYNFTLNVDSSHLKEKESIHGNVLTNIFIRPMKESSLITTPENLSQNRQIITAREPSSTIVPLIIHNNITNNNISDTISNASEIFIKDLVQKNPVMNKSFGNNGTEDESKIISQVMELESTTRHYKDSTMLNNSQLSLDDNMTMTMAQDNFVSIPTQKNRSGSDILLFQNTTRQLKDITLLSKPTDTILSLSTKNYTNDGFDQYPSSSVLITKHDIKSIMYLENNNISDHKKNSVVNGINVSHMNEINQVTENITPKPQFSHVSNNNKTNVKDTENNGNENVSTVVHMKTISSLIEPLEQNYISDIKFEQTASNSSITTHKEYIDAYTYEQNKINETEVKNIRNILPIDEQSDSLNITRRAYEVNIENVTSFVSVATKPNGTDNVSFNTFTPTLSTTDASVKKITAATSNFTLRNTLKLQEANVTNGTTYIQNSQKVLELGHRSNESKPTTDHLLLKTLESSTHIINQATNMSTTSSSISLNGLEIMGSTSLLETLFTESSLRESITDVSPTAQTPNIDNMQIASPSPLTKAATGKTAMNPIIQEVKLSLLSNISHAKENTVIDATITSKSEIIEELFILSPGNETSAKETAKFLKNSVEETFPSPVNQSVTNKPLVAKHFDNLRNITGATSLLKAETDKTALSELTTPVTQLPAVEELSPMKGTDNTTLETNVRKENTFTEPINLRTNQTTSGKLLSLNETTAEKILYSDKISNIETTRSTKFSTPITDVETLTKLIIPVTKVQSLEQLPLFSVTEATLSPVLTDERSLPKLKQSIPGFTKVTIKNETELAETTVIPKTIDDEQLKIFIKQVTNALPMGEISTVKVEQVTTPTVSKVIFDKETQTKMPSLVALINKINSLDFVMNVTTPKPSEGLSTINIIPVMTVQLLEQLPQLSVTEATISSNLTDERSLPKLKQNINEFSKKTIINVAELAGTTVIPNTIVDEQLKTFITLPIGELSTVNAKQVTTPTASKVILEEETQTKVPSLVALLNNTNTLDFAKNITTPKPSEGASTININPVMTVQLLEQLSQVSGTEATLSANLTDERSLSKTKQNMPRFTKLSHNNKTKLALTTVIPKSIDNEQLTNPIKQVTNTLPIGELSTVNLKQTKSPNIFKVISNEELHKLITTEPSKLNNSTQNVLKSDNFDKVIEPVLESPSMVEIINVTDLQNEKDVSKFHEKDSISSNTQDRERINNYTELYKKKVNKNISYKEVSNQNYIKLKMPNDTSISETKDVNFNSETNNEKEELPEDKHETTTVYYEISELTTPKLLGNNYHKRQITSEAYIPNLITRPSFVNGNVESVQIPKVNKTSKERELNTHTFDSANNTIRVLDEYKKNVTNDDVLAYKTNNSNIFKTTSIFKIKNNPNTTSTSLPDNITYGPTNETTSNLNSTNPSATGQTNSKENLNNLTSYCLNRIRGRYADNSNCRKFYICVGKLQPIIGVCPNNTVFSEINKQCTRNLSHCVRNNQFHCLYEGRFIDYTKDNIYYMCVKHYLKGFFRYKLQCLSAYHLNKVSVKCEKDIDISQSESANENYEVKSNQNGSTKQNKIEITENTNDFECKKEGNFTYPKDNKKYYVCYKNKKDEFRRKIKKCSCEKVFDEKKHKCVTTESSDECKC